MPACAIKPRSRVVVHAGQAHVLVEVPDQPLAQRHRRFGRPVEGHHLEALAVVQLEKFGRQQAHGVHVQVARQIADLDAPGAWRRLQVQRLRRRLLHLVVHEARGRQQLQQRVVAQAHRGQQRGAHQELVGRDITHRQVVWPGALLLADVHVMLDHVGLRGLLLQAAPHQRLGLGVAAQRFQQPRGVVQRVQHVFGRGRLLAVVDVSPQGQRGFVVGAAFAQVAQVQVGRREAGLRRQRGAVGQFSLVVAAQRRQHRAPVEAHHMAQRRRGVGQPDFIQRGRDLALAGGLQRLRLLHQRGQRHLAATRGRKHRGLDRVQVVGGRVLGNDSGHGWSSRRADHTDARQAAAGQRAVKRG